MLNVYCSFIHIIQEEEAEKSGVVLICGSMNWDVIGRKEARVNSSKFSIS